MWRKDKLLHTSRMGQDHCNFLSSVYCVNLAPREKLKTYLGKNHVFLIYLYICLDISFFSYLCRPQRRIHGTSCNVVVHILFHKPFFSSDFAMVQDAATSSWWRSWVSNWTSLTPRCSAPSPTWRRRPSASWSTSTRDSGSSASLIPRWAPAR